MALREDAAGPSLLGASIVASPAALHQARADLRTIRAALDYLAVREARLLAAVTALEALAEEARPEGAV